MEDSWDNSTENTEGPDWSEHYLMEGERFYNYGFPVFFFIGLFGNILGIILMTRGTIKQMSSGVYLLLLSISDQIVCILYIAEWFPVAALGIFITSHSAVCKGHWYLRKLFEETSSWMIVAITIERASILIRPSLAWIISRRKISWIVSGVIFTVLALINIYQPFIYDVVEDEECFFVDEYNDNLAGLGFAITDLLLYSFIPSIILIVCNVALVFKLNKRSKSYQTADVVETSVTGRKRIIAMVIGLSILFVVLTLPHSCFIISDFIPPEILWVPTTRELWFFIVSFLVVVNHSINIFLYFLAFRQEFWDIFKCCKCSRGKKKDIPLHSIATTTLS